MNDWGGGDDGRGVEGERDGLLEVIHGGVEARRQPTRCGTEARGVEATSHGWEELWTDGGGRRKTEKAAAFGDQASKDKMGKSRFD
jgi:hypothetical protein